MTRRANAIIEVEIECGKMPAARYAALSLNCHYCHFRYFSSRRFRESEVAFSIAAPSGPRSEADPEREVATVNSKADRAGVHRPDGGEPSAMELVAAA